MMRDARERGANLKGGQPNRHHGDFGGTCELSRRYAYRYFYEMI